MIVCIGDSITFGQHLGNPMQAWPRLITGHDILPAGVPSDTTRLALERFPRNVQEWKPRAVVIQFGHNDCNRWDTDRGLPRVSAKAYAANLEEMVMRCLKFGAKPLICDLTPSHRSVAHGIDVAEYNEILLGVADATGTGVIGIREKFLFRDGLLMDDGLHLSIEGHQVYAATVQKTLDTLFP